MLQVFLEATFDHPRKFCDEHWARWWGGFEPDPYGAGFPSNEEAYREALDVIAEKKDRSNSERTDPFLDE